MPERTAKRIKSYLPVCVRIHAIDAEEENDDDVNYFYVKEHLTSSSTPAKRDTLFVANCPVVPHVRTSVVLQSLLGRYGEVQRVTVVDNPRSHVQPSSVTTEWTRKFGEPQYLPSTDEGTFAHVVFDSPKELKKTLRSLEQVMGDPTEPFLTLDRIEIQTLRDNLSSTNNDHDEGEQESKGVLSIAARYRQSCPNRDELLMECNAVMQEYEEEVARQEEERLEASKEDEDGFVTVTYQNSHKKQEGLEMESNDRRRNKKTRSRKKKKKTEALTDFYRFQTKQQRKRNVEELRERFEKDLAYVKSLKEERKSKPFG